MKKDNKTYLWLIACIVIGIVILIINFFMCKEYLGSEIKLKTTAEVIEVQKTKINKNNNILYKYNVTWQFKDEDRGVTKTYNTHDESNIDNVYNKGQKRTIYIYSDDGENYKHFSIGLPIGMTIVGFVFIVVAIIDIITMKTKKKNDQNMRDIINQRIQESGNSNIKNG